MLQKHNPNWATCPNSLSEEQVCKRSEERQETRRDAKWEKRSRLARRLGNRRRGFMGCRSLICVTVFVISRVNMLDLLLCESRSLRLIIQSSSHEIHCYVKIVAGAGQRRVVQTTKNRNATEWQFHEQEKGRNIRNGMEKGSKRENKK